MLRKQSQTRFQPLIGADRVFSLGATKPIRSIEVNQIGTSFLLLALLLRPPRQVSPVMLSLMMRLTYQINICWLCFQSRLPVAVPIGLRNSLAPHFRWLWH